MTLEEIADRFKDAAKNDYIIANGRRISFVAIAKAVAAFAPKATGAHIDAQLDALGLSEEFEKCESPFSLPYSFSDYDIS
jgi:hypothetical protein